MLRPLDAKEWNPQFAAHLLNRACFGASPSQIQEVSAVGPEEAVHRLMQLPETLPQGPHWVVPGAEILPDRSEIKKLSAAERQKFQQERRRAELIRMTHLRGWWLDRMLNSSSQLQEKMTLFWHGHFATSIEKVQSAYAMYAQNETLRKHALGNWREMLISISKDPAMLIYLDNAKSKKAAPNENYARELMELFTLGEGNYTENDIKEAARAFTGWSVSQGKVGFEYRPGMHDKGGKIFMGQKGNFDGIDIIDIILKQPRAAFFICRKLWEFFAYSNPTSELVEALAETFRKNNYEIASVIRCMLLSEEFYSSQSLRTQIKSPVQWLVSSLQKLDGKLPHPVVAVAMLKLTGQSLFAPPNVKGWDGGYSWITTANLLHRYTLAGHLIKGGTELQKQIGRPLKAFLSELMAEESGTDETGTKARKALIHDISRPSVAVGKLLAQYADKSPAEVQKDLQWRLFNGPIREKDEKVFRDHLSRFPDPKEWKEKDLENILHLMMSTPQFQLT